MLESGNPGGLGDCGQLVWAENVRVVEGRERLALRHIRDEPVPGPLVPIPHDHRVTQGVPQEAHNDAVMVSLGEFVQHGEEDRAPASPRHPRSR